MSDKKYKYTVKKFAKMLTVHPDKRVTFQDTVDIRNLVRLDNVFNDFLLANELEKPQPPYGFSGIFGCLYFLENEDTDFPINREDEYWKTVTEHGALLGKHDGRLAFCVLKNVVPPFGLQIEYNVPPENVAAWLAATGFPQISRAKEEPPVES